MGFHTSVKANYLPMVEFGLIDGKLYRPMTGNPGYCNTWIPTHHWSSPFFLSENFQSNVQQGNESWNETKIAEKRMEKNILS